MIAMRNAFFVALSCSMLAACGGGSSSSPPVSAPSNNPGPSSSPSATPTSTPTSSPTSTPTARPTNTPAPTPSPSAAPLVIHIGFQYGEFTDPAFGPVWYYSPVQNSQTAQVVQAKHGSLAVFENDDPFNLQHTASGLGSNGFPQSFDNKSGFKQNGTTIDGGLTWSTGTLNPGQRSQTFTIGPPGDYYFGCNFHYTTKPTKTNGSMGDVVVST